MPLTIRPLAAERWPDLEAIFNAKGCSIASGCWCMYYRRSGQRSDLAAGDTRSERSRQEPKALADQDPPPGLLGYEGKNPVGWVSLGAREDFRRLSNSPVMKAVDSESVWSIVCFVVPSEHRKKGVARRKPARPGVRLKVDARKRNAGA